MIKFGTSGFRGIIDEDFNEKNVQKIGFAFRELIRQSGDPIKIIIGHDNRLKGAEFAKRFCEAACCELIHVTFMTVSVPTPFIAFKAANNFDYGVMITASHNPPQYNGLAFLLKGGRDADDGFSAKITELLDKADTSTIPFAELKISFCDDISDYADKIVSMVDTKCIKKANLKVLFNAMHGSGTETVKQVFQKIGVEYHAVNDNVDTNFGGRMPAPYPHNLVETIVAVKNGYDFGFALDGDGDRVVFIDSDGKLYDCNYLSAVLVDQRKCGFVKSYLASNLGMRVCKQNNLPIHEARVGFKFVGGKMEETGAELGAEQQGIGIKGLSLKKDGVGVVALVIDAIAKTGKGIGELVQGVAERVGFPSVCLEYAYYIEEDIVPRLLLPAVPDFNRTIVGRDDFPDGYRLRFENDYWCAARKGGSENNIVRLYTEMLSQAECEDTIAKLEKFYKLDTRQK